MCEKQGYINVDSRPLRINQHKMSECTCAKNKKRISFVRFTFKKLTSIVEGKANYSISSSIGKSTSLYNKKWFTTENWENPEEKSNGWFTTVRCTSNNNDHRITRFYDIEKFALKSREFVKTDQNQQRVLVAKRLRKKFGTRYGNKIYRWNDVLNTDFSELFTLTPSSNHCNEGVYAESPPNVPHDLKSNRLSGKFVQLPFYYKHETYGFHHCVERPYLG